MSDSLTKKEAGFVKDFIETGNGVQSALKNYDTEDYATAGVIAHENLKKPKIINAIQAALPDDLLAEKHLELLKSTTMDHMVFPLGPKKHDDLSNKEQLSDDEIREMLAEINCKVRRIQHGETSRHVFFWTADNRARKDALDMAYKLRGSYAPDKHMNLDVVVETSQELLEAANLLDEHFKRGIGEPGNGTEAHTMGVEAQDKNGNGHTD